MRPINGFRDAGQLEQVLIAQLLHESDDLRRQVGRGVGRLDLEDFQLARRIRIVDPEIETTALDRVVDFTRPVRGDDDDRRLLRRDRADFRNRDLEVAEDLEQERLEGFVGAVQLVDQQDRRSVRARLEGLQQRAADQEPLVEYVAFQPLAVAVAHRFRQADLDHLPRVVPLVDRGGHVEPLVTLQADQGALQRLGQYARDLRLADTRFAFQKQRPLQLEREEQRRRQAAIRDIAAGRQEVERSINGGRNRLCHVDDPALSAHGRASMPAVAELGLRLF